MSIETRFLNPSFPSDVESFDLANLHVINYIRYLVVFDSENVESAIIEKFNRLFGNQTERLDEIMRDYESLSEVQGLIENVIQPEILNVIDGEKPDLSAPMRELFTRHQGLFRDSIQLTYSHPGLREFRNDISELYWETDEMIHRATETLPIYGRLIYVCTPEGFIRFMQSFEGRVHEWLNANDIYDYLGLESTVEY